MQEEEWEQQVEEEQEGGEHKEEVQFRGENIEMKENKNSK